MVDFEDSVLLKDDVLTSGGASTVTRVGNGGMRAALRGLVNYSRGKERLVRLSAELKASNPRPRVLVVGGGTAWPSMRELFYYDAAMRVVVFDIYDSPEVHFIADAHKIPLPDDTFDCLIIQAVLEHVLDPQRVVREIWRVLKPGGRVYSTFPFLQAVHEAAYDFSRVTPLGHRWLFRRFDSIDFGTDTGPGEYLLWAIDYFARGLFRSRKAGKAAKLAFFWVLWLDRLIPSSYAFDATGGSYFIGAKRDTEMKPSEIIGLYRGADAR